MPKTLLVGPANTPFITLCVMWAKTITLDASCAGTAIQKRTMVEPLEHLPNTSLLGIGVD